MLLKLHEAAVRLRRSCGFNAEVAEAAVMPRRSCGFNAEVAEAAVMLRSYDHNAELVVMLR
jgi:hypothetical protein